ncbi:hypothetical protein B0T25DRAFT_543233 [Lasiosphaeria hispida]|uniref:Uncharacterized protein n=1 Tax=Lasiosphaeria hispida TaxID=260671 RepID=A0AAJ0HID2_9PEZI|nr:hypothetical protein B0T25DRAFT_543233 [Lasiosphaeria hispida]
MPLIDRLTGDLSGPKDEIEKIDRGVSPKWGAYPHHGQHWPFYPQGPSGNPRWITLRSQNLSSPPQDPSSNVGGGVSQNGDFPGPSRSLPSPTPDPSSNVGGVVSQNGDGPGGVEGLPGNQFLSKGVPCPAQSSFGTARGNVDQSRNGYGYSGNNPVQTQFYDTVLDFSQEGDGWDLFYGLGELFRPPQNPFSKTEGDLSQNGGGLSHAGGLASQNSFLDTGVPRPAQTSFDSARGGLNQSVNGYSHRGIDPRLIRSSLDTAIDNANQAGNGHGYSASIPNIRQAQFISAGAGRPTQGINGSSYPGGNFSQARNGYGYTSIPDLPSNFGQYTSGPSHPGGISNFPRAQNQFNNTGGLSAIQSFQDLGVIPLPGDSNFPEGSSWVGGGQSFEVADALAGWIGDPTFATENPGPSE